jgi:serine/threonine protein kinase
LIEQWITGAPLSAVLAATGKFRAIDALALIHGALQGLSYAHGREVVHGDVTPANILIDQSGTPMLVDFGLAVSPGQTSLGGTPGYMAPEAAAGQPVDKRSDVYSSCVVLAELLTGARLFTTTNSLALTRQQATAAPRLGRIERPVAAVLGIGLHPRPDDRPTDAETLLTQLESAIEETHGRRWLAAAGLGAIGSTAATIAAGTADRNRKRRNHHGSNRIQDCHLDAQPRQAHRRRRYRCRRHHRRDRVLPITPCPATSSSDRRASNDPTRRRSSRDRTSSPIDDRRRLQDSHAYPRLQLIFPIRLGRRH